MTLVPTSCFCRQGLPFIEIESCTAQLPQKYSTAFPPFAAYDPNILTTDRALLPLHRKDVVRDSSQCSARVLFPFPFYPDSRRCNIDPI